MNSILQGVRVLELGQVLAGPFAGAIFADLGAEVIKIERLNGGDDARHMGPAFREGDAHIFQVFNRGKKSLTLDLKSESGLAVLKRLAGEVDILIHNLRPGVPQSLGIDGPTLCKEYPRLIYCEISAYGGVGPMGMHPGYEPLIQAFSGLSAINGGPDDPPMRAGSSLCDQGSGMWAVIGALSLLQRRHVTGQGGVVSTSLLEAAMVWNGQKTDALNNEGRLPERHRSGHPGFVPYEAFQAADGPLLICCGNDRLFSKLAEELGRLDWLADERFKTNRDRLQNKSALLEQLSDHLRDKTRAYWLEKFEAAGVPCAPIHSLPEAIAHPQVQALGIIQTVPGENFKLTGLPLVIDGHRPQLKGPAPKLGQHNSDLLITHGFERPQSSQ